MLLILQLLVLVLLVVLFLGGVRTIIDMVRWLVRFHRGAGRDIGSLTSGPLCPVCKAELAPPRESCTTCGWHAALMGDQAASRIARRQLQKLAVRGAISQAQFDALEEALAPWSPASKTAREEPQPRTAEVPAAAAPAEHPEIALPDEVPTPLVPDRPAPPVGQPTVHVGTDAGTVHRPAAQVLPPTPPTRSLSEVLSAFMEERHIRWGELVGGLLIVCCSAALVISFWSEIAERPLLKFGVFNGLTAGLFGLGLHAARRWKLPTTSQGLLIIATLLVPLNFLAIAAFSRGTLPGHLPSLIGEAVSVALFATLLWLAERPLLVGSPGPLTAGVLLPSCITLLIRRYVQPGGDPLVWQAFAAGIVATYLGANAWHWRQDRRVPIWSESVANGHFKVLGLSSFAALMAFALLVYRCQGGWDALRLFAPLVASACLPPLGIGLAAWRRVDPEKMGPKVAGLSIAGLGLMVLAASIVLSWPDPLRLILTAAVSFLLITWLAMRLRMPELHFPAGVCLLLVYLLLFHIVGHRLSWQNGSTADLVRVLLSASSGNALVGLVGIYLACALGTISRSRISTLHSESAPSPLPSPPRSVGEREQNSGLCGRDSVSALPLTQTLSPENGGEGVEGCGEKSYVTNCDSRHHEATCFTWLAAGVTCLGLVLVSYFGFGLTDDAAQITWTYFALAGLWAAVATYAAQALSAWFVGAFLLVGCLQAIVFRYESVLQLNQPWVAALLTHAGLVVLAAAAIRLWSVVPPQEAKLQPSTANRADQTWSRPLTTWGFFSSCVALAMLLSGWLMQGSTDVARFVGVASGIWLALAWLTVSPAVATAGQAILALAVVMAVAEHFQAQAWFQESRSGYCHPYHLQAQGLALAGYTVVWRILRILFRVGRHRGTMTSWQQAVAGLLNPPWPSVDRITGAVAVVILLALTLYATVPGAGQELSLRTHGTEAIRGELTRTIASASRFELPGVPHGPAREIGSWWLLASLVVVFLLDRQLAVQDVHASEESAEHARPGRLWRMLGWLAVIGSACLLLASRWEAEISVASALRWWTAICFALGSLLVWNRKSLRTWATRAGISAQFLTAAVPQGKPRNDTQAAVLGLAVLVAVPLIAMGSYVASAAFRFHPPSPTALDLLWQLSIVFAVGLALGLGIRLWTRDRSATLPLANSVLVLATAPLLAQAIFILAVALGKRPITGPEPDTFFYRMGLAASYAVPIFLVAATLIGQAYVQWSSRVGLAAGLLLNVAVTVGYLLQVGASEHLTTEHWICAAQWNALAAALYSMAWQFVLWHDRRGSRQAENDTSVLTQIGVACGFAACSVLPLLALLFQHPTTNQPLEAMAGPLAWFSLQAVFGACSINRGLGPPAALGLIGVATLLAAELHRWDHGSWLSYRVVLGGILAACGMLNLLGWQAVSHLGSGGSAGMWHRAELPRHRNLRWLSTAILFAGIVFSLRMIGMDPATPWSAVLGLSVGIALSIAMGIWTARRWYLGLAALLINVAVGTWWWEVGRDLVSGVRPASTDFWELMALSLALPALLWLWIERRWFQPIERPVRTEIEAAGPIATAPGMSALSGIGTHRVVTVIALAILARTVLSSLANQSLAWPAPCAGIRWSAIVAALVASAACRWDGRARFVVERLWLAGLVLVGMIVDVLDAQGDTFWWAITIWPAVYCLATSYLWRRRQAIESVARRFGAPARPETWQFGRWMPLANVVLALAVVAAGLRGQFVLDDFAMRGSSALAVLFQTVSLGFLAVDARRARLQSLALWIGVLGIVALCWSGLAPHSPHVVVHRAIAAMTALAVATVFYGLGFSKVFRDENDWTRAARMLMPALACFTLVTLAVVLSIEVEQYVSRGATTPAWAAVLAVAMVLIGLAAACLTAALVPGRDPFSWSESRRQVYVYVAEALLGCLFLHVRVTMPWLFQGFFTRYWPLVVMGISYLGVGLSEWMRRRRQTVLSQPLERTGVLLPLLPVMGFWIAPSQVHFSILTLLIGGMYATLSITRKSFGFGILAALATNGSLWYLLYRTEGLGLWQHPQIWLIPPALCVLAAAYINRGKLTESQMAGIRYLTSSVIYVASTADIFLNGVAQAPWLPLVLAGLAILGIMAGILLRVRAFLFLGTAFLLVALLTMIWHAAVDLQQTWLWYVTGIVVGILIIATFAMFEKRRERVLSMVEALKSWTP